MPFLNFFGCYTISDKVADCSAEYGGATNTFSWEDLKKRSGNFSTIIGSGGFSTVYLAKLPDSTLTAIKIQSVCTERLTRIHEQELQILLRLKHPNIVKLLGHCNDREQEGVLLFEYVSNGTLHEKLQTKAMSWKARTSIARQLASALEYLHGMQIIHGDIKSSNILLDEQENCKLCDFGSAKLGFSSMVLPPCSTKRSRLMVMGSHGYVDPDYLKTGLVSKKNDVYSYGVVLLELVTGREAFSLERGEMLTEVVKGVVEVEEVVDPRLRYGGGGVDMEEVKDMVEMAVMCIGCLPMNRPCASEIVAWMKEKF
ncbi:hypothetical protein L6452_05045 [Arctium lappa]|uniref:Uncharacterized protein n=1 Tax=Arctium lappa TaxID=4217 RepID=A0ACB9EFR2_ARCLA|nr:hypothetical protein L6452_05045 [Arctium lappa]